jgi:hypothetical protein
LSPIHSPDKCLLKACRLRRTHLRSTGLHQTSHIRAKTRAAHKPSNKTRIEGKAWMRTSSPCVALPFGPGLVQPELVGFLLHPVSRSETWRRLGTRRTWLQIHQAFTPRTRGKAPGAEPKNCRPNHLADVSLTTGTGRLGGTEQRFDTCQVYAIGRVFSSACESQRTA